MIMHEHPLSWLEFRVSGIFPETAWRAMNCRQTTKAFLCYFWVPKEEPPGGMILNARRHLPVAPSFLGLYARPGSDEHSPGDASQFDSILVFWDFWDDSD